MSILVDTNVLLRVAQTGSADHIAAKAALLALQSRDEELCLVPQIIYEYWVVATRPTLANGLGMSVVQAEQAVKMLLADFSLHRDERGVFDHWQALVTTHDVKGKNAHDARLVAAMLRHRLTRVLTFNTSDFSRFNGIEAVSPANLVGNSSAR